LTHIEGQFPGKSRGRKGDVAVKKKRFSAEHIVAVLKQAEIGVSVADLIRQVEISERSSYRCGHS
jgi:hypothetical protein